MAITLNWTKKNTDVILEGYEIYRGTNKDTLFQVSNLLATISNKNAIQYIDETAALDTPYWFSVRSKTIYGDLDSTPVMLVDCTNPGIGGLIPVVGDYADGFIESITNTGPFFVAANKIITEQALKFYPASNIDSGLYPVGLTTDTHVVNKFWKDGKIIFVPNVPNIGMTGSILISGVITNVINPLIADKPRIEIDGIFYQLGILTRAEAVKYFACGSRKPSANAVNHYTDRVTPKTFETISQTSSWIARALHAPEANGDAQFSIVNNTVAALESIPSTSNVTSAAGLAWYFTPVNP